MSHQIHVSSEIGQLKKVIIHTPGKELEQMTPETAMELLYDDILHLPSAIEQHNQLSGVLAAVSETIEVHDALSEILKDKKIKEQLVTELCGQLLSNYSRCDLMDLDHDELAHRLVIGTELVPVTLTQYLSQHRFALPPLPNLFYTRDSATVINEQVFIGNMANRIRISEAILMSYIFHYHQDLSCDQFLVDASREELPGSTFEGGDIQILRHDCVLIGMSERTNTQGIDYIVEQIRQEGKVKHIFAVILPRIRATIHLDMVFTMIDSDKAVVYPPLILSKNGVDVIHIDISKSGPPAFSHHDYLLKALQEVDIRLDPVYCGGEDTLHQEREQWQSGANFFSIAPGKVIGYGMNFYTFEALADAGMVRVEADDVISGRTDLSKYDKYAVAISGSELTRGGGGCRCMTMPVLREEM